MTALARPDDPPQTAAAAAPVAVPPAAHVPLRIKLGNGFGSVAFGVKENGFAVLLLIFYNQVMGLEARLVGTVLLIALLLDAAIDPVIGTLSDRTHSRWGKRHPWMFASIIPMAFAWLMLWNPPQETGNMLFLWLLGFAFMLRASVSMYEIPSLAVVAGLSSDYDERTSITRWRFLFGWAGGLFMLLLAFGVLLVPDPPRYPVGLLNMLGYHHYGWAGAGLMVLATLIGAGSTLKRIAALGDAPSAHLPPLETVRAIGKTLSNRAFLILMASSLFAFINQGFNFSITSYLLTFYWQMPQSGFIAYSVTLFIGIVGAFFLIGWLQPRVEKRTGAMLAASLSLCFGMTPYVLRELGQFPVNGSSYLIPILFTFITISNALSVTTMMFGQSMATDIVESSQLDRGERSEGVFFSAYFFTQKCASGLGIFVTGNIIAFAGLATGAQPGSVAPEVLTRLAILYGVTVVIIAAASIWCISKFPIRRAHHEAVIRQLAEEKARMA